MLLKHFFIPLSNYLAMNLIIDIGNSGTKLALYDKSKCILTTKYKSPTLRLLTDFTSGYNITGIILSSVGNKPTGPERFAHSVSARFVELTHKTKLPFKISYLTPETLGTDRIAAIAGVFKMFPGAKSLVIDAGTAITFDLIERDTYLGGNISPGIDMRFRALNRFTRRLPLLERRPEYPMPGKDTASAIVAGVIEGIVYEINEYIRTFEEKYRGINVVITGGDGLFLRERLNEKCIYSPEIVTDGLNYILECNA